MFWGSAGQPPQLQCQGPQELQLFGGGRDPFSACDDLLAPPFPGRPGGGGLFGGIFGHMDRAIQEMDEVVRGAGGRVSAQEGSGQGGMLLRGLAAGGGGGYTCQTMVYSSTMGRDGQMRTERYASSTVGDLNNQMREVQQAYSNSRGMDKMSLERQMRGQGRKTVKELCRQSGEERTTDLYKGMSEEQYPDFDRRWQREAVPRLPAHPGPTGSAGAVCRGTRDPDLLGLLLVSGPAQPRAREVFHVYTSIRSTSKSPSNLHLPRKEVRARLTSSRLPF